MAYVYSLGSLPAGLPACRTGRPAVGMAGRLVLSVIDGGLGSILVQFRLPNDFKKKENCRTPYSPPSKIKIYLAHKYCEILNALLD